MKITLPLFFLLIFFTFLLLSNIDLKAQEKYRPSTINFLKAAQYEKLHPLKLTIREKKENNSQKVPGNLPLPPGAQVKRFNLPVTNNPTTLGDESPLPMLPSPVPNASFRGVSDNSVTIPPDGGGAVGPAHVFAAENHQFVIRNKRGDSVSSVSPVTFFKGVIPGFSADPHIKYDQYSGRWIITGQSDVTTTSSLVIAVSQTSDPTGNYNKYVFRIDPDSAQVADFPMLGYNKKWVVITTNLFNIDLTAFTGTALFVIDKAALYSGAAIDFATNAFRQLSSTPDGSNPCPVTTFSEGAIGDEMYLLQNWNAEEGLVRLTKVSGNLPGITWPSNAVFPKISEGWGFFGGETAPQLGDNRKINTGDARIQTLVERNGLLWACQNIFINDRAIVQWMQLSPTGNLVQTGRIDNGTEHRVFPSLAVSASESVLIGYSRFSSTTYASAAYSFRSAGTPFNTLDDEHVYKRGLSTYYKTFNGGRNRWGDYSSSAVDPITGNLWTKQEIADQRIGTDNIDNNSRYATWWAEVVPTAANVNVDAALTSILAPLSASTYCDSLINPRVTLRNNGIDPLKTVTITTVLDNVIVGNLFKFNGNIPAFNNVDVSLNQFIASPGEHTLKIYTSNTNGVNDQRKINDTVIVSFTILSAVSLPVTEGFESPVFPPPGGWSVFNPLEDNTWERTELAAKTGNASMKINGYQNFNPKAFDIFRSPTINITTFDSIYISFDVAYAKYSNEEVDTLEVVYSTDCGLTWIPTTYKKWGAALATNGNALVQSAAFLPTAAQWRNEKIALGKCGISGNNILVGLKFTNNMGQDCYIDNFIVSALSNKQQNTQLISFNKPFETLCTNNIAPEITLSNQGSETLKTLTINYRVDDGPVTVFNYTGDLAKCGLETISLTPITAGPGTHVLIVYTSNPNGVTDQFTANDTLRKPFTISAMANAPVIQDFEAAIFPPENWSVLNNDLSLTWEKTTLAAKNGLASLTIRNFDYPGVNTSDKFISPVINFAPAVDSVFASFDYAYAAGARFPGGSQLPVDTLEIQITQDCGQTTTTVFKKWGFDLQTVLDANNSIPFSPANSNSWQNVKLFLTPVVGTQNFQVYFVAKSNKQNNIFIDNINIYTITLPQRLKDQGYLIYPNPSSGSFLIQHFMPPVNLQSVSIYNSFGQLVWQQKVNGLANTQIPVNLAALARGVYIVKLSYTDKTTIERIVKN